MSRTTMKSWALNQRPISWGPAKNPCGMIVDGCEIPSYGWLKPTLPSGKRLHSYGKSPCLMGKSTISMAMFNSYVSLPEGKSHGM